MGPLKMAVDNENHIENHWCGENRNFLFRKQLETNSDYN